MDKVESLVKYNHTPFMDAITKDYYKLETDIERDIKAKVIKFRKCRISVLIFSFGP